MDAASIRTKTMHRRVCRFCHFIVLLFEVQVTSHDAVSHLKYNLIKALTHVSCSCIMFDVFGVNVTLDFRELCS